MGKQSSGANVFAGLLMAFQGVVWLAGAGILFAASIRLGRLFGERYLARHDHELAWIALAVSALVIVVAVAVASGAAWARLAALVIEGLTIFGALLRFGAHPLVAILGILFAGAVIALLLFSGGEDKPSDDVKPAKPAASAGSVSA